jgi:Caspase domain
MDRIAILFGNSVAYGDASKNIPRGVIQSHLKELSAQLQSLDGEYAFETEISADKPTVQAREAIRKIVRKAGKQGSTLLFYYFGHAVRHPFKDELYFYSPDSELDDPGGMLKFSDIVGWLGEYQPKNTVLMLDCCYAGTVAQQLHVTNIKGNYFVMASVNAKDKALVDYNDEQAYGVFSKYGLQAFTDPRARDHGRDVSFKSFFTYVKERTKSAMGQEPYSVDGNLASEIFFQQTTTPNIPARIQASSPKKSIYQKLFVIGRALVEKPLQSEKFLYSQLKKRRTPEFLQPYKSAADVLKYEFVSPDAFRRYIRIAETLGIIENRQDSLLRLTDKGREMMVSGGRNYNRGLFHLVQECWSSHGLTMSMFEDAIYSRIKRGDAPSLRVIHRDLALSGQVGMSKDLFRVLFDLTGFVGALNYSAEKTFFPPASDQERLWELES